MSDFHTTTAVYPFSSSHTAFSPFPRTFSSAFWLSGTWWVVISESHWFFCSHSFSVTFFPPRPSPFFILLQINSLSHTQCLSWEGWLEWYLLGRLHSLGAHTKFLSGNKSKICFQKLQRKWEKFMMIKSVYYHTNLLWSILGNKWMKVRESTPTPKGCEKGRNTCLP